MEKFVATLKMHTTDVEAPLMKEIDIVIEGDVSDTEEDSTNLYDHIPLLSVRKAPLTVMMTNDGSYSLPSASTSPTCSGPPSPVTPSTPHWDSYLQQHDKLH